MYNNQDAVGISSDEIDIEDHKDAKSNRPKVRNIRELLLGNVNTALEKITDRVYDYTFNTVKNYFGTKVMVYGNDETSAMKFLYYTDKDSYKKHCDRDHIFYVSKHHISRLKIGTEYIVKLDPDSNTYVYVRYYTKKITITRDEDILFLYFFGKKYAKYLHKYYAYLKHKNEKTLPVFSVNKNGSRCKYTTGRTLESIYMDKSMKDGIINYIDNWKVKSELYETHCVPFKLGLLFYGPHGTGKTSFIKAIAHHIGAPLFIINLNDVLLSFEYAADVAADDYKERSIKIFLFEDIDIVFGYKDEDKKQDKDKSEKQNENDLLQILDGVRSVPNAIYIATTNYPEKLTSVMTRPGRFDKRIEIAGIDKDIAETMCSDFNVDPEVVLPRFNGVYPIIPAQLQEEIMKELIK